MSHLDDLEESSSAAQILAPDLITREQWTSIYRKDRTWGQDPCFRMANEGMLKQVRQDLRVSKPLLRLRLIEEIRWWVSEEGCREAIYKFSTVVEAMETIIPGLTIEGAREAIENQCDEAEKQAYKMLEERGVGSGNNGNNHTQS